MATKLIQSVQRATNILELFLTDKGPLGITDFSHQLGLPKATIAGLVATLEAGGYLEKELVGGKYRLGQKVFHLGVHYSANMDIVTLGRAWIERLCFQFMEAVNVGMLVGDRIVLIMRAEPKNGYMVFPQAGSILPAHSSCIGKTLFAYMDEEKRDSLLAGYNFERFTPNTIGNRESFLAELKKVREAGVSFENEESISGLVGIGGPIFNNRGEAVAAFVLSGNPQTMNERRQEIVEAVKFTSRQVSSQLGFDR
jgi:DNA-binding IclR family transcriptional regulator